MVFRIIFILVLFFSTQANAEILYQTGWEYGGTGDSEAAVEDTGNPLGAMSESSGGSNINADALVVAVEPFGGSNCLQIDWLRSATPFLASEWFVQSPSVMGSNHEYYVGFAIKKDDGDISGGKGVQWLNRIAGDAGEEARKLLYRVGGDNDSLLFEGTKSDVYCTSFGDTTHAPIYVKNRVNTCDDYNNQPCGEKLYPGGPKCSTETDYQCLSWPGCTNTQTTNTIPSDGEWHIVIVYVKEHATDGVISIWLDDNKIFHADKNTWDSAYTGTLSDGPCPTETWDTTVDTECTYEEQPIDCNAALGYDGTTKMFNTAQADFGAIKFPTYFNSGPVQDQSEWWDNFIIATTKEEVDSYLNVEAEASQTGCIPNGQFNMP